MRTITLAKLFSPKQLKEIERICKSTSDSIERVKRLKDYYSVLREDLERQDILPEYLAYATEAMVNENSREVFNNVLGRRKL